MRTNHMGVIGELTTLPGCSQVVVSHAVFIKKDLRGRGFGKAANRARIQTMKCLGYDYTICTVIFENKAQRSIMKSNGWKAIARFSSSNTGKNIIIYGRTVK